LADTGIAVSPSEKMDPTTPSPLIPELMEPVKTLTKQMFNDVPVIPFMSTGATDGRYLRAGGIPTYGVSGLFLDPADVRAHGRDERVPQKSLYESQEFLYQLVKMLSTEKPKV
jgi:acetylornithine deacetylase/succinyl-diaminopimelate desuccinylase-like protein